MDGRQAAEDFNANFKRTYARFFRRVRPTGYRPSPETLAVLEHLEQTGPLTVTEAARHLSRSQAAMSEILARIEARGLVDRVTDQRDRRRSLVWPSKRGQTALADSRQLLSIRLLTHAMEQLSPSVRQQLAVSMANLLETKPAQQGFEHD